MLEVTGMGYVMNANRATQDSDRHDMASDNSMPDARHAADTNIQRLLAAHAALRREVDLMAIDHRRLMERIAMSTPVIAAANAYAPQPTPCYFECEPDQQGAALTDTELSESRWTHDVFPTSREEPGKSDLNQHGG